MVSDWEAMSARLTNANRQICLLSSSLNGEMFLYLFYWYLCL